MSKKAGTALSVMAMVFMGALASPLTVLAADAEETYQPALYATIWALLPPLVAIVLAAACGGNRIGTDHKRSIQFSVCGNCSRSTDLFRI